MNDHMIVALDVDSAAEARTLVARLGGHIGFYKVGMELYAAAGMDFVRELLGQGKDVFLDMKYYDIGETVKRAVRVASRSGVRFLTVHGSSQVMRAAVAGRADAPTRLLAVTVLTSFDQQDLADMGYECTISSWSHCACAKPWSPAWTGWYVPPWTPPWSARRPAREPSW